MKNEISRMDGTGLCRQPNFEKPPLPGRRKGSIVQSDQEKKETTERIINEEEKRQDIINLISNDNRLLTNETLPLLIRNGLTREDLMEYISKFASVVKRVDLKEIDEKTSVLVYRLERTKDKDKIKILLSDKILIEDGRMTTTIAIPSINSAIIKPKIVSSKMMSLGFSGVIDDVMDLASLPDRFAIYRVTNSTTDLNSTEIEDLALVICEVYDVPIR